MPDKQLLNDDDFKETSTQSNDQHSKFKWFKINDLLEDSEVHNNTKDYFRP